MSLPNESSTLAKAFSGILGVDEKSMLEILVKWHPEDLTAFKNEKSSIFVKDKYFLFERWQDYHIAFLVEEFLRFQIIRRALRS
eukprot:XP_019079538.1 PREDICTED: uncharacterized protein LOC109123629 [Vitis vinifera]